MFSNNQKSILTTLFDSVHIAGAIFDNYSLLITFKSSDPLAVKPTASKPNIATHILVTVPF